MFATCSHIQRSEPHLRNHHSGHVAQPHRAPGTPPGVQGFRAALRCGGDRPAFARRGTVGWCAARGRGRGRRCRARRGGGTSAGWFAGTAAWASPMGLDAARSVRTRFGRSRVAPRPRGVCRGGRCRVAGDGGSLAPSRPGRGGGRSGAIGPDRVPPAATGGGGVRCDRIRVTPVPVGLCPGLGRAKRGGDALAGGGPALAAPHPACAGRAWPGPGPLAAGFGALPRWHPRNLDCGGM